MCETPIYMCTFLEKSKFLCDKAFAIELRKNQMKLCFAKNLKSNFKDLALSRLSINQLSN